MEVIRSLCRMHSVVMLQEVHGVDGDHLSLQALLPSHTVYANFRCHTGIEGTILLVDNQILQKVVDIQHDAAWLEGRCQELKFLTAEGWHSYTMSRSRSSMICPSLS